MRSHRARIGLALLAVAASAACTANQGETSAAGESSLAQHVATTPGVVRNGQFILRNSNTTGVGEVRFNYGNPTDVPIVGDWDGDGVQTPGVFRNGMFYLRNSNGAGNPDIAFALGLAGDIPVAGDWDGDGVQTIGVFRQGHWYLRNSNSAGAPDVAIQYGLATDVPVVGDWDGNGTDTVGVVRNGNNWILRNSNVTAPGEIRFTYGNPTGDIPVAGDWDGNGTSTPGVYRGGNWFLRNTSTAGPAEITFNYGLATDTPIPGSWKSAGACPPSNPGYLDIQAVTTGRFLNGVSYAVLGEPTIVSIKFVSSDATPGYRKVTVYVDGRPRTMTISSWPGNVQYAAVDGFMVDASTPLTHTLSWTTSCGTFTKTFSIVKESPTAPIVALSASPAAITAGASTTISGTVRSNVVSTCGSFRARLVGRRASDGAVVVDETANNQIVWSVPQSPSGTTDYTLTASCTANASMTGSASARVTVNAGGGGGGGGGSTCQSNGIGDIQWTNASNESDVYSIWVQDLSLGTFTYLKDIGVGATVDFTPTDCHYTELIAVSANEITSWNQMFNDTLDPHSAQTAQLSNFWRKYATFIGKTGGATDVENVF